MNKIFDIDTLTWQSTMEFLSMDLCKGFLPQIGLDLKENDVEILISHFRSFVEEYYFTDHEEGKPVLIMDATTSNLCSELSPKGFTSLINWLQFCDDHDRGSRAFLLRSIFSKVSKETEFIGNVTNEPNPVNHLLIIQTIQSCISNDDTFCNHVGEVLKLERSSWDQKIYLVNDTPSAPEDWLCDIHTTLEISNAMKIIRKICTKSEFFHYVRFWREIGINKKMPLVYLDFENL